MEFVWDSDSAALREVAGVPGREIAWKGEGEKPPLPGMGVPQGVPDGVWALMTDEGVGVTWPVGVWGPALITDGDGAGDGEGALRLWDGTMPGKTGVMGVVGAGWAGEAWFGTGVDGVDPWGMRRGPLLIPGVVFCGLPGLL